jgi:BASS family bile acid:Na+ symporter
MSVILTIAVLTVFIIFFAVRKIGRLSNIAENKIISLLLLVTMKNYGLAGGLALLLFSEEVAFAALAFTTVNFLFTNWLKYTKIVVGRSIVAEETPPS